MERQGTKIIEDVTRIECRETENMEGKLCKIESQQNIPGKYSNVQTVDIQDTKLRNHENRDGKTVYEFSEPETCEVELGAESKRIKCNPETGI